MTTSDLRSLIERVAERGGPLDLDGDTILVADDGPNVLLRAERPEDTTVLDEHEEWQRDYIAGVLRRDLLARGAKRVETTVHADGSDCEVVIGIVGQEGPDVLTATLKAWLAFTDSD